MSLGALDTTNMGIGLSLGSLGINNYAMDGKSLRTFGGQSPLFPCSLGEGEG